MDIFSSYKDLLGAGDFSDIFLEESRTLAMRWEDGKVENVTWAEDAGAGLRILNGLETRTAHTDLGKPLFGLPDADRPRLIKLKNDIASGFPSTPTHPLRAPVVRTHLIRQSPSNYTIDQKMNLLRRAYDAAQRGGPNVRQISINYGEKMKRVGYLNSEGQTFLEDRTYLVFSLTVTVERNGDLQNAYESMGGLTGFELFDGDAIERTAAMVSERAHQKLNAPPAPTGEMPVVIASSAGGTLIHEAVGHSLEADAVLEGTSPAYVGKLGKVVANEKLTVFDDPTVPGARGSFHFDDEGTPSEPSKLIDKGVLKDFMYDRLSARRAGRASNGHGRRESYAHRPIPRMSNTFIAPGPDDPQEILRTFRQGLLVTKMGGGQVNTANGDFVFEVEEGFLVEDGKRKMIRGATLLGNGPETLMMIDAVGSDHGWGIGTCGKEGQGVPVSDALPTVRIKKLVIGGR
jgi:TldD protein